MKPFAHVGNLLHRTPWWALILVAMVTIGLTIVVAIPRNTLNIEPGNPAAYSNSANFSATSGVFSDGFRISGVRGGFSQLGTGAYGRD